MSDKHVVRFEPVDLEMEVHEDETVLDAAFRQGISLMHGCREGQCSACKSFLLDGDAQHDRYSTFALADYESEEGYVLLCKLHPFSDLTVELINFDEEELRNAVPIQELSATVEAVEPMTRDIVSLRLRVTEPVAGFAFKPGQYADVHVPGRAGAAPITRSFSMATCQDAPDRLEFLIKKYPGGLFSGLLDGTIAPGTELRLTGPYGSCTLRKSSERDVVMIGGGAGMAPLLGLLRQLRHEGSERRVTFYYGARTAADLFYLDVIEELGRGLAGFSFTACLSDEEPQDGAAGEFPVEAGLVTDVVDRLQTGLADADVYLCGPPPMVDATLALLEREGVPLEQTHYDKFTTSVTE